MKILITGTDTEVGKTLVTCALASKFKELGKSVVAIKPVESGWDPDSPSPDEDGAKMAIASGQEIPKRALTVLKEPLAPPFAAKLESRDLDPAFWVERIQELSKGKDLTIVEGAGGLLSPLANSYNAVDLAKKLDAKAVIVASDKLGCLNHAFLTLSHLRNNGIETLAVVFSCPERPDRSTGSNEGSFLLEEKEVQAITIPRVEDLSQASVYFSEFCEGALD